jgi:hypothetical protein
LEHSNADASRLKIHKQLTSDSNNNFHFFPPSTVYRRRRPSERDLETSAECSWRAKKESGSSSS